MERMFSKILYELEKKHPLVLVSIISKTGSSPQRPGALMLAGKQGRVLGTVGGGAVEKRCEEAAVDCLQKRLSREQSFGLHQEGENSTGMACGGDVTVWFQFIDPARPEWADLAGEILSRLADHQPGWLILKLDGSHPALADREGNILFGTHNAPMPELSGGYCFKTDGCFYLPLNVRERAVVFGGGHCAQALVPVLSRVGFRVTVFECRPEFSTRELFPEAEAVICGDFSDIAAHVTLTASDYVVVMTSGHIHDLEVERQVLRRPAAYVGVIGSRRKVAFVNQKLREAGIPEEAVSRVHSPIGIPIKAVTPEEIAISVAGEMIYERALIREAQGIQAHGCPMH